MNSILKFSAIGMMLWLTSSVTICAQEVGGTTPQKLHLSLDNALEIALTQGNKIKIAEMDIVKAKYDRKTTIAKLFPSVNLTGDYNYTIKKQVMYLGGGFSFPGMPDIGDKGIEVGKSYSVTGGITAGLPLVNPSLWSSIKLSAEAVNMAVLQAEESKEALHNQVTKAYYGALLAEESLKVLQQTYNNAKKSHEDIKMKFEQGLVAEFDLLRADVAVKNIEPGLQQALNGVAATKRQLLILLSLDLDRELELSGALSDKEEHIYRAYFSESVTPENNTQLKLADKQVDLLKIQERLAKSAFLPTITLSGFYRYNAMDDKFSWKDYQWTPFSVMALSLNIPITSGGEKIFKVNQAKAATKQAILRRIDLSSALNAQLRQFRDNMKASVRKFASAKEAVTQAEKGYEIARKRYDVGMSTLIELNDANLALLQSKLNYFEAIYDFLSNEADYNKTLGVNIKR
ncbi:TolC family protein [Porphyromonas sp.]|uniref:TolC family protein n=1 Tax=Porphyromonas sp. TaxID=1924944 RepID=UPI0026DD768C|nr:TolC family protein [Porphyromonas sp.]MDO4695735.1 TolC family protein [Porphyromonas sp.]MDO4770378.1 TolC family protein [Porphyromonas sp.]